MRKLFSSLLRLIFFVSSIIFIIKIIFVIVGAVIIFSKNCSIKNLTECKFERPVKADRNNKEPNKKAAVKLPLSFLDYDLV